MAEAMASRVPGGFEQFDRAFRCSVFEKNAGLRVKACAASSLKLGDWEDGDHGIVWSASEIAAAVGGTLIRHGNPGTISTDTRSMHRGDWFLALVGHNFDGNKFLERAVALGCSGAIGREMPRGWLAGFVQVKDGLQALHGLARSVRKRYRGPVVGVTGSTGKTTTRALTTLALESLGHVHHTQGNLNNNVGLPLTLLRMPSNSAACVLEMGMNHSGEILELSTMATPSVRVILNAGPAHMEHFNSLEEIGAAKAEIFLNTAPGDICILNADDPLVMHQPVPEEALVYKFGRSEEANVRVLETQAANGGRGVKFVLEERFGPSPHKVQVEIGSPGFHLAVNACAASCIARSLGIPLHRAAASISKYSPLSMRSNLELLKSDIQLINDAYNSNPMSLTAALEVLKGVECRGRKVVALGDMLELGDLARKAHVEALTSCEEIGVSLIGVTGTWFCRAVDATKPFAEVVKCQDAKMLANQLVPRLEPGDVVLVKGSRGMRMEAVVEAIRSAFSMTTA